MTTHNTQQSKIYQTPITKQQQSSRSNNNSTMHPQNKQTKNKQITIPGVANLFNARAEEAIAGEGCGIREEVKDIDFRIPLVESIVL